MILVDSNVLLDLTTDDPAWADWSQQQLTAAGLAGELAINDVVYAEISVRCEDIEQVETLIATLRATIAPIPRMALFLAGKAFQRYRAAGGVRPAAFGRRASGFLHRSPCAGRGGAADHARRAALPDVFSRPRTDRAGSQLGRCGADRGGRHPHGLAEGR